MVNDARTKNPLAIVGRITNRSTGVLEGDGAVAVSISLKTDGYYDTIGERSK
jgi:hypothetical protein